MTCHMCTLYSLKALAEERKLALNNSLKLHQFYRDMDEEEAWIR